MMWTKELVIELIEMFEATPASWNIQCKEYRDRNFKYALLSKLASRF